MNFIKKIFDSSDGKIEDELVHLQFQKFSKGEFRNRAIIEAKTSRTPTGTKCTINTSAEFANELVRIVAENLGNNKTNVTGAIVSTSDMKGQLDFKEIKQFQGVKRYIMDVEMSGSDILGLLEKIPKSFFALSFESGEFKLKIKPKAPKSGKPGKGDEAPKADFCKLITTDKDIVRDFVFEVDDFKKVAVNHTFMIEEIVVSDELKKTNDFARIREEAKRKGRILRNATVDEREVKSEKEFSA